MWSARRADFKEALAEIYVSRDVQRRRGGPAVGAAVGAVASQREGRRFDSDPVWSLRLLSGFSGLLVGSVMNWSLVWGETHLRPSLHRYTNPPYRFA